MQINPYSKINLNITVLHTELLPKKFNKTSGPLFFKIKLQSEDYRQEEFTFILKYTNIYLYMHTNQRERDMNFVREKLFPNNQVNSSLTKCSRSTFIKHKVS